MYKKYSEQAKEQNTTIQVLINELEKIVSRIEGDRYTMESLLELIRDLNGHAATPQG